MKPHLLLLLAAVCLSACSPTSNDPDMSNTPDTSNGPCVIACDAVYAPIVIFDLQANGATYCGPLTISYMDAGQTVTQSCECDGNGKLIEQQNPYGDERCAVDPPHGETTTLTIDAPGYQTLQTDVDVACQCHPRITVNETLMVQ